MRSLALASQQVFIPTHNDAGGTTAYLLEEPSPSYAIRAASDVKSEVTCIYHTSEGVRLRFFFGTGESDFCGHGVLGATAWLKRVNDSDSSDLHFVTGVGRVSVHIANEGPTRFAEFVRSVGSVELVREDDRNRCLAALGLSPDDAGSSICVNAGNERTKTLLPLLQSESLATLTPNPAQITAVCESLGSTGLYPFVVNGESSISARQFPIGAGFLEDAATATAALGFAAAHRAGFYRTVGVNGYILIEQGFHMGRPCEIRLRLIDCKYVAVGGRTM